MDEIKELVGQALEQKRVLSRMKAELRAQVFLAIDEQEKGSGNEGLAEKTNNPQRASLLSTPEGRLLVALVREFLEWSGMEFTIKVFAPEMGPEADYKGRMELCRQLGVASDVVSDSPLLLSVLKQFQSGSSPAHAPGPAHASGPASSLSPRTAHLAPIGRAPPLAPLADVKPPDSEAGSGRLPPPAVQISRPATSSTATGGLDASPTEPPARSLTGAKSHPDTGSIPASTSVPSHTEPPARPATGLPPALVSSKAPTAAPPEQVADESYADDLEVEDDFDLENAEIIDDDEDYMAVFTKKASAGGADSPAAGSYSGDFHSGQGEAEATGKPTAGHSDVGAQQAPAGLPDLSESNLSTSSFTPGRIRPLKSRMSAGESGLIPEDMGSLGAKQHGEIGGNDDLTLSGDRSFGISHELGGLAPPPPAPRHSANGSLSLSGELPPVTDNKSPSSGLGGLSVSHSGDLTASGSIKPAKLEPLAPLGGRPPLSKLAPLGKSGLPSIGGLAPLVSPPSARKDPGDIKEELRRDGLLTLDRSQSVGSRSRSASGSGDISDRDASLHASQEDSLSGSLELELPDNTYSQDLPDFVAPPQRVSGSGPSARNSSAGGVGVPVTSTGGASTRGGGNAGGALQGGVVKPLRGGVYDAEFSISQSFAEEVIPEEGHVQEDMRSSLDSDMMGRSANLGPSSGGAPRLSHNMGLSMDMRETGLSASDKSGELDMGDFAETAEWT